MATVLVRWMVSQPPGCNVHSIRLSGFCMRRSAVGFSAVSLQFFHVAAFEAANQPTHTSIPQRTANANTVTRHSKHQQRPPTPQSKLPQLAKSVEAPKCRSVEVSKRRSFFTVQRTNERTVHSKVRATNDANFQTFKLSNFENFRTRQTRRHVRVIPFVDMFCYPVINSPAFFVIQYYPHFVVGVVVRRRCRRRRCVRSLVVVVVVVVVVVFVRSLSSFLRSFLRSFVRSFAPLFFHSFFCSFFSSFVRSFVRSFIR